MSLPGAILPAWGYHLTSNLASASSCFLALSAGVLAATAVAGSALRKYGIGFILATSCVLACAALLYLSVMTPPAPMESRLAGFFGMGAATGLLNTAIFHAIARVFRHDPAGTVNLGGSFFGLGCVVGVLLITGASQFYTVPSVLTILSLVPGFFAISFAKGAYPGDAQVHQRAFRQSMRDFRGTSAILFSLLLFFQFGNEWSIAGWLALFLIQRLGVSPTIALLMLALYWTALLLGRIVAQAVLPDVRHGRLLLVSVLAAMFGCIVLALTNNLFGAATGILLVGGGFASIYPLVVEKIGSRFPFYQPGFFNGIFSLALTAGLIAPWMLGYLADWYGIQIVMAVPLAGTIAVFILLLLIWLEAKMTGHGLAQL